MMRRTNNITVFMAVLLAVASCAKTVPGADTLDIRVSLSDDSSKATLINDESNLVIAYGTTGMDVLIAEGILLPPEYDEFVLSGDILMKPRVAKYSGGKWSVNGKFSWPSIDEHSMYTAMAVAPAGAAEILEDDPTYIMKTALPHDVLSQKDVLMGFWVSPEPGTIEIEMSHILGACCFHINEIVSGWEVKSISLRCNYDVFAILLNGEAETFLADSSDPYVPTLRSGTEFGGDTGRQLDDVNFFVVAEDQDAVSGLDVVIRETESGTEKTLRRSFDDHSPFNPNFEPGHKTKIGLSIKDELGITVQISGMQPWSDEYHDLGLVPTSVRRK